MSLRFCFVFLLLTGVPVLLSAQDTNQVETPTVEEELDKKLHQDMFYIDLMWDRLLNMPTGVEQRWYGRGVNLGLLYDYPLNKNGNISVALGGGFQSHNYYLNSIVNTYDSAGQGWSDWQVVGDTILSRGKISVNYIDVPFEIRFRTDENRFDERWKFAVGAKVGYLLQAHEKRIDNENTKIKLYNYPHVAQFRYGVSARVGYGAVMLSAFYSLSPFFESPFSFSDQNALSIGISIVPF